MHEINADSAGEGSGSATFGDYLAGYDAFMLMAVILKAMAKQKCTSPELAASIPRYQIIKKSISCSSSHVYSLVRSMKDIFPDAEFSEGDAIRF